MKAGKTIFLCVLCLFLLISNESLAVVFTYQAADTSAPDSQDTSVDDSSGSNPSGDVSSSDLIEEALENIRTGRVNKGVQTLLELGHDGDAEAFFHLGQIYAMGAGRNRSADVAAMYYRLASQLGHRRSELSLANMLYFEIAAQEALKEAAQIYQKYAIIGDPEAQYVLGLIYWNGELTGEEDPIRGFGLIAAASDKDYQPAIDAELEMITLLSIDDRIAGKDFARDLTENSFKGGPIGYNEKGGNNINNNTSVTSLDPDEDIDWSNVWHLEVGAVSSSAAAEQLKTLIFNTMADDLGDIRADVISIDTSSSRFRLVFGPMPNFQESVLKCVKFKGRGHDCFTRAPK